ncbi:NUDIX domain-containing protein [Streptomyces sp. TLI_171]|uniref:NUDIX domain-containing protein n=1 Tax=Streptomyces sp. TLI_171 TaxID=1938859 RepID=UPI000C4D561C|nr:NUDIX domain-containing protein [Streptomyces sp. TLI_171]RKE23313.1 hypothetical protein BX266_6777 [Streptomyces sp. TLI_171]
MTGRQPSPAVPVRAGALLTADGRACLIRRQRPGDEQYTVPGGPVAAGETPRAALRSGAGARVAAVEPDDPCRTEVVRPAAARRLRRYPDVGSVLGAPPGPGTARLPAMGEACRWR